MEDLLKHRYQALFNIYGAGANLAVVFVKEWLTKWMDKNTGNLRPDGAYFLLVNFDQMIIRPHAGYIPTPGNIYTLGIKQFKTFTEQDILPQIDVALGIILESYDFKEMPISAHDIMQSIHYSWNKLQNLFGWG